MPTSTRTWRTPSGRRRWRRSSSAPQSSAPGDGGRRAPPDGRRLTVRLPLQKAGCVLSAAEICCAARARLVYNVGHHLTTLLVICCETRMIIVGGHLHALLPCWSQAWYSPRLVSPQLSEWHEHAGLPLSASSPDLAASRQRHDAENGTSPPEPSGAQSWPRPPLLGVPGPAADPVTGLPRPRQPRHARSCRRGCLRVASPCLACGPDTRV